MNSLIDSLRLTPHPEGGYFRETYRASAVLPGTNRSVCTAIFYFLPEGQFSSLHRIDADELWHFYEGDPLCVVELQADRPAKVTQLSALYPQHLVPAGTWFGAMPAKGSAFSLVGCTVSPGFDFAHFELGTRAQLTTAFPHAREIIERLTRS